jgi:hypothetical protein
MKLKLLREGILTLIYAPMVIGHGLKESDASLIAYVFFFLITQSVGLLYSKQH